MQMSGQAGLSGWRWIFIWEGLITCVIALVGAWLLVDFPDSGRPTWRFLGSKERAWICARVHADRGDAHIEQFSIRHFLGAGADLKIWAYALVSRVLLLPCFAFLVYREIVKDIVNLASVPNQ
jgi:hypothetical protein